MENFQTHLLLLRLLILILANSLAHTGVISASHDLASFNRSNFSAGFIFGTASSAYQYEGAAKEDGRGPSTWDVFTHKYPGKIKDHSNEDVAIDSYHRDDFQDHTDLCLKVFGERVKHWITLNEPRTFSNSGYNLGLYAPGRCSKWVGSCSSGNSATEPYLVAHHQLLAHAAAVEAYKDKYQATQKGKIGITLLSHWMVPYSKDNSNNAAAQRALDFMFRWFMHPLTYGDYPQSKQSLVGRRLPKFSVKQSKMVKRSFDFLGQNYYTTNYAANVAFSNDVKMSYSTDSRVNLTTAQNGVPIGPRSASDWLFVYPRGIWELLRYTKRKYNSPVIYITENGISEFNTQTLEEALTDKMRINYYYHHLLFLNKAIKEGVDVRGYFAWSLLDDFEWTDDYTVRFGITYLDYKNGLKKYLKHSANWFKRVLQR